MSFPQASIFVLIRSVLLLFICSIFVTVGAQSLESGVTVETQHAVADSLAGEWSFNGGGGNLPMLLHRADSGTYHAVKQRDNDSLRRYKLYHQPFGERPVECLHLVGKHYVMDGLVGEYATHINDDLVFPVAFYPGLGLRRADGRWLVQPDTTVQSGKYVSIAVIRLQPDGSIRWLKVFRNIGQVGFVYYNYNNIPSITHTGGKLTMIFWTHTPRTLFGGDTLIGQDQPHAHPNMMRACLWMMHIDPETGEHLQHQNLYAQKYAQDSFHEHYKTRATDADGNIYYTMYWPGNGLYQGSKRLSFNPGRKHNFYLLKLDTSLNIQVCLSAEVRDETGSTFYDHDNGYSQHGVVRESKVILPINFIYESYDFEGGPSWQLDNLLDDWPHWPLMNNASNPIFRTLFAYDISGDSIAWLLPASQANMLGRWTMSNLLPTADGILFSTYNHFQLPFSDTITLDSSLFDTMDFVDVAGDTLLFEKQSDLPRSSHLIYLSADGHFQKQCEVPSAIEKISHGSCAFKYISSIRPKPYEIGQYAPPNYVDFETALPLPFDTLRFSEDSVYVLYGDLLTCGQWPDTPTILTDTVCVGDQIATTYGQRLPCMRQEWVSEAGLNDTLALQPIVTDIPLGASETGFQTTVYTTLNGHRLTRDVRQLQLFPSPLLHISSQPAPCSPDSLGRIQLEARYPASALSLAINGENIPYDEVLEVLPSVYAIHLKDSLGCTVDTAARVNWTSPPNVEAQAMPFELLQGEPTQLTATPSGLYGYKWLDAQERLSQQQATETAFSAPGEHRLRVVGIDSLGCKDTASVSVFVKEKGLALPTAYSPNGDELNEVVEFAPDMAKRVEIQVFNRWGTIVHSSAGSRVTWDGRGLSGKALPEGVYMYQLQVTWKDGSRSAYAQSVTLIR